MKLLVVSEGKHELNSDLKSGALVQLLERIVPQPIECTCRNVSDRCVETIPMKGKRSSDYEKRALRWLRYAEQDGFQAQILLVDEDGFSDRLIGISAAQDHMTFSLPRAMGIAIRTFDVWMLADEQALSRSLGHVVTRQKSPEDLSDPKGICRQILDSAGGGMSLTQLYVAVAKRVSLSLLAERCPRGFAPFHQRAERLMPIENPSANGS